MPLPNDYNFLKELKKVADSIDSFEGAPNFYDIEKDLRSADVKISEKLEEIRKNADKIYQEKREKYRFIEEEKFETLLKMVVPYINFSPEISEKLFRCTYANFNDPHMNAFENLTAIFRYLDDIADIINKKNNECDQSNGEDEKEMKPCFINKKENAIESNNILDTEEDDEIEIIDNYMENVKDFYESQKKPFSL